MRCDRGNLANSLFTPPTNAWLPLVDDDAPRVSFGAPTYPAFEQDGFALVNVWLSKPVADTVEFDYLILDGTSSPCDYLPASGHRVFSPGVTNVVLVVNLTDDTLWGSSMRRRGASRGNVSSWRFRPASTPG